VPEQTGGKSVKWLQTIHITNKPLQQDRSTSAHTYTDTITREHTQTQTRTHTTTRRRAPPNINADTYTLEVVIHSTSDTHADCTHVFALKDLKKDFNKNSVTVKTRCGRLRQKHTIAQWSGVSLRDILQKCEVEQHTHRHSNAHLRYEHVHFEGMDKDAGRGYYGASIPLRKAIDPYGDVVLAYEMNGETLSRDHG